MCTRCDPIYDRYGAFQRLSAVSYKRADHGYRLVERVDFSAVAHFANADAAVSLGVSNGPAVAITRLEEMPTEQWRTQNLQNAGTLQKRGNEF